MPHIHRISASLPGRPSRPGALDSLRDAATARAAQKDTRLLVISRDKIVMLCETYPQLGYRLMYNLAADLAMKIRNTDLRIREQLLYKPTESK